MSPPKLRNDVLVTIWVPAQAKFQLRLGSVPIQLVSAFCDLVFLHIRFCKFTQRNTVKPRFTDLLSPPPPLIRTAHYSGQLLCPWGKKALTFSLNSIRSIRAPRLLSLRVRVNHLIIFFCPPPPPPVSVLTGFDRTIKSLYEERKVKPCLAVADPGRGAPGPKKCFWSPPPLPLSQGLDQSINFI